MSRRLALAVLALSLVYGCAGPSKLAQRSEEQLAGGEHWRAWQLAVKALDREPGNMRARSAAAAAAGSIAREWEQRIHTLASSDSLAAADQVLEFADFRANAVRYAIVPVSPDWAGEEQELRRTAARLNYERGKVALASARPRKAYLQFMETQRYVPGFRDAERLADRAYSKALVRVAVVPFGAPPGNTALGPEIATRWRNDLAEHLAPPNARFTRILGIDAVERQMTVSEIGRNSREDALRLGRKAGADRVVWGSIGGVKSDTRLQVYTDRIWRRVVEKDPDGREVVRWEDAPFEVIARVRTVTANVDYEVIATKDGAALAHQHAPRTTSARVVWTSFSPEGDVGSYSLVSETTRSSNPDRVRDVETRWRSTCGDNTTLRQVLEARVATRGSGHYSRDVLGRFIAGAAFVFLEDLPPTEDLAIAALAGGWRPLRDDLVRLDTIDDVDLGVALVGDDRR